MGLECEFPPVGRKNNKLRVMLLPLVSANTLLFCPHNIFRGASVISTDSLSVQVWKQGYCFQFKGGTESAGFSLRYV